MQSAIENGRNKGGELSHEFEPRIVAFCCNYSAYAAADLAGALRLTYPPNVRIIRVPCSGKVEMAYLLKVIEDGADGVMVVGCLEGDCHHLDGNLRAKKRVEAAKRTMKKIGIEPDRVEMRNLCSAMADKLADVMREMTERVRKLGPSPLREGVAR